MITQISAGAVLADVVWPALLLAARERSIWAISAGIISELVVLRYVFPLSWKKAIIVDVTMNALSAALGAFLLPAAGFLWEFFPGQLYMRWLHMGTFNPITWAATCIIAVFLSTGIESAVVRVLFGYELTKRRFWSVALANLLSTAIAFCSLLIHPPQF